MIQVTNLCLTAGSLYMDALYAGTWSDASGVLTLEAVPGAALEACLEFIYVGEAAVEEAALVAVLEAAGYLQMPELIEAATGALTTRLGPATALATWEVAERQGLAPLAAEAEKAAARHFTEVAASEAWLSAPAERVRALLASERTIIGFEHPRCPGC